MPGILWVNFEDQQERGEEESLSDDAELEQVTVHDILTIDLEPGQLSVLSPTKSKRASSSSTEMAGSKPAETEISIEGGAPSKAPPPECVQEDDLDAQVSKVLEATLISDEEPDQTCKGTFKAGGGIWEYVKCN